MAFSEPIEDIERVPMQSITRSFTADEDVTAGQLVKTTSDNGVEPSDTDGEASCVGIVTSTRPSGKQVNVILNGLALVTAGDGTISQGDLLASHGGSGEEGEVSVAATDEEVIGRAYESSSAQGDTLVALINGAGGTEA